MIKATIYTPKGVEKEIDVKHIQVNLPEGSFGILENHVPIISVISKGTIELNGDNNVFIALSGAIFKFKDNIASITCEYYEFGDSEENALNNLNEALMNRQNENRERNIELALAENELKKQIKKTGAGNL